jgi:hypothetical protein
MIENVDRKGRKVYLRKVLLRVGALAWIALLVILAARVVAGTRIPPEPIVNSRQLFWDRAADPKPGDILLKNANQPVNSKKSKILVVALGSCSSCTIKVIDIDLLNKLKNTRKIAVMERTEGKAPTKVAGFDDLKVISPAEYSRLNANWTPRAYVLDGSGALIRAQTADEEVESIVRLMP